MTVYSSSVGGYSKLVTVAPLDESLQAWAKVGAVVLVMTPPNGAVLLKRRRKCCENPIHAALKVSSLVAILYLRNKMIVGDQLSENERSIGSSLVIEHW